MKVIEFIDKTWEVPDWTKFVTNDRDGTFAWEFEPEYASQVGEYWTTEEMIESNGKCMRLNNVQVAIKEIV